jgi:hypothetical protein
MRRLTVVIVVLAAGIGGSAAAMSVSGAQAGSDIGTGTSGPGATVTTRGGTKPPGPPTGIAQQQTHPSVLPVHGFRRSNFSVTFTLADAPGHRGVTESDYRIQVDRPARSRAACVAPTPASVTEGEQGARTVVALSPPRYGWCRGTYTVRIYLGRGPYCPASKEGQPPPPCPEFASQDLRVGQDTFVVTAHIG